MFAGLTLVLWYGAADGRNLGRVRCQASVRGNSTVRHNACCSRCWTWFHLPEHPSGVRPIPEVLFPFSSFTTRTSVS